MSKLLEKKPILHAVLWIIIYIVLVNIGDAFSEQLQIQNSVTSLLLLALSLGLLVYVWRTNRMKAFGVQTITKKDFRIALFYIPLILIALSQYLGPINPALSTAEIAFAILLMLNVGFLEELIFRGFLYQGINSQSGVKRAVIISGITFGLGHIVNLLRGYGAAQQIEQILLGITLGIGLALLVAITKSIIPGFIFHSLLNTGGTIIQQSDTLETYTVILALVLSAVYAIYLYRYAQKNTTLLN